MPSILSRLRTHAVSQSSRSSAQSVPPVPAATISVTTPTHMERPTGEEPINEGLRQESGPHARKIYTDIDRLTDDFAAEPIKIRHGLPPPVRRGLSNSSNHTTPARGQGYKPDASLAVKEDSDSPKASPSNSSSGNNTPSAGASASGRGFIERLGTWSTFGRRRAPPPSL